MSTLAEIEKAADALSQEEKERLILFLAARLRGAGAHTPPPRTLSREQVDAWIAEARLDPDRDAVKTRSGLLTACARFLAGQAGGVLARG
jgi:hypothetical protein